MVIGEKVGMVRNQGLQMLSSSCTNVVSARFTNLNNRKRLDSCWCWNFLVNSLIAWDLDNIILFFGLGAYRKLLYILQQMSDRDIQRFEANVVLIGIEGNSSQKRIETMEKGPLEKAAAITGHAKMKLRTFQNGLEENLDPASELWERMKSWIYDVDIRTFAWHVLWENQNHILIKEF